MLAGGREVCRCKSYGEHGKLWSPLQRLSQQVLSNGREVLGAAWLVGEQEGRKKTSMGRSLRCK